MPLHRVLTSLLFLSIQGCGSADTLPETVPVSGTVTFEGDPVPFGTIALYPLDDDIDNRGRPPMGEISEGAFRLTTFRLNDGAIPGRYKVLVDCHSGGPSPENPRGKTNWIVPERYAVLETSPLEVEITPDGEEIHLEF